MAERSAGEGDRKPIRVLRERAGGTRPEVSERNRRHRRLRKAIRTALAAQARTVPELAAEIAEPAHETLWMLMAMKKYGEIREGEERDGYYEYHLVAKEAEE